MSKTQKPVDTEAVVETEDFQECCGKDECEDCPMEDLLPETEWLKEPIPVERPADTYTAKDGDTYASIAAAHKSPDQSTHDYATVLFILNKGKNLSAGTVVKL